MIELNKDELITKIMGEKALHQIKKKVGYVAIIGRPNAGKSTFINTLIDEKVSIVSSIPQTTRKRILAIYNDEKNQIIFFDTPGYHKENKLFNEKINESVVKAMQEASVILYFIDPTRPAGEEEASIKELLSSVKIPVIKVFSKADLKEVPEDNKGKNIIQISSKTKVGFVELIDKISSFLPTSELLYPEDHYTVQSIEDRVSEVVREKVFQHTKQELPHSIYVGVEDIEETPKLLKMICYIYTETESQKYILIGKGGSLVSSIGTKAREEIEKIYDKKVFISVRVKVMPDWRKNEKIVNKLTGIQ